MTLVAFPIVGIGASAGGLEAFELFFKACSVDSGMAFVLVPHLSPDHHSLLTEILQRSTAMPVAQALDQQPVKPNCVYIIPPDRDMAILNGVLQLSSPDKVRGLRLPIDRFFSSLADDQAQQAIGIILSGTASDGTLGLQAIFRVGGVCMVQEPSTAKYDGMPKSAIQKGYATHVLKVEAMPALLQNLTRQSGYRLKVPPILTGETLNGLNQILLQIRSSTGHDFSLYKKSTIGRRIERRMALYQINEIAVYARFLKQNAHEVHTLYKELLINVTSFFRDAEAFGVLKQEILPPLLAEKGEGALFRVWVAGCASGEEAYSIAMVLRELMDQSSKEFKVQIYATDLDEDAISTARSGRYPASIESDVTPERLHRFFIHSDHGYTIKREIREMVVFAVQSLIKDSPFTKLDLLSCRNLLIYLEQELQNRLIPTFHYALNPNGVLFLSNSESITNYPLLFKLLNRKWRFYQVSKLVAKPNPLPLGCIPMAYPESPTPQKMLPNKLPAMSVADLSHRVLLQTYAPASVTTDAKGNILFVHGDTSRYLATPAGPVTTHVVEMAREGVQMALRAALQAAMQGEPTLNRDVTLKTAEGEHKAQFSLRLLSNRESQTGENLLLISFQEIALSTETKRRRGRSLTASAEQSRIEQLERDLLYARENQQATVEELQAINEELKSANEELQSTNEELQSTNEELETSKEELQSLNEETLTANSELNSKIEQLSVSQNDLKNLMDNVNTGIIFLDYHLNIRSYTREAVKVYRLIATDVGRPLGDITSNLQEDHLLEELRTVLEKLIPCEHEVQTLDGAWYRVRMQPYRTLDHLIDGVVLILNDISLSHQAQRIQLDALRLAQELTEGMVNTVIEPLMVLDSDLRVVSVSHAFYAYFQREPEPPAGQKIYELSKGLWNIPLLHQLLEELLPQQQTVEGFVVEHHFAEIGFRRIVFNARRIKTALGDTEWMVLAIVNGADKEPL